MGKSMLAVVANSESFIVGALMENLRKRGITAEYVDVAKIDDHLFLEDYVLIASECLNDANSVTTKSFLRTYKSGNFKVFLLGTDAENKKAEEQFSKGRMAASIRKPIDVKGLSDKIIKKIRDDQVDVNRKKVILAVDDSGMMLRTISGWLEREYELKLANSAAKAMTMLENPKPDLILLDYEMPVCSGAQFFQMIREEKASQDIPVVFLTNRDDADTVKEVLSLKPEGYILKSCTKEQLKEKISKVL